MIALVASVLVLVGCSKSEQTFVSPISGEEYTAKEMILISNCVLADKNPLLVELRKDPSEGAKYFIRAACEGFVLGNRTFDTNS